MTPDESPPRPPTPSPWRFAFSLRMMFLVTALVAVLLAVWRTRQLPTDYGMQMAAHCDVYYDNGNVVITCLPPHVLDERALTHLVQMVAQSGPITGMTIRGVDGVMSDTSEKRVPVTLTANTWAFIRQMNLRSLSVDLSGDSDVSPLKNMSSLTELDLAVFRKPIPPSKLTEIKQALPKCRTSDHFHPDY
jgi:hypothetical protein